MSNIPAPASRFDQGGDWLARQFFSADDLKLSPEDYVARHGGEWLTFSLHHYRFEDPALGTWVRRVAEILAAAESPAATAASGESRRD